MFNPHLRIEAPELRPGTVLRFITSDDYPPFNFALPDGTLAGYNVDLARALCEDLKAACTIQARRFDTLLDTLENDGADAIAASLGANAKTLARADFSLPYFPSPAHFVVRAGAPMPSLTPEGLSGRTIGVVANGAHEAWLKKFFPGAALQPFPALADVETAMEQGRFEIAFGDAADLGLWLNGAKGAGCCAFVGGPWLDANYFGDGHAIAVRRNNMLLRRAIDAALLRLGERGVLADLYLRYFPVGLF